MRERDGSRRISSWEGEDERDDNDAPVANAAAALAVARISGEKTGEGSAGTVRKEG